MSNAATRNVKVQYRNSEPQKITLTGVHRDGEYKRKTEYKFDLDGSTAVLTHMEPKDSGYQVQMADEERFLVEETVAKLPFVQGVVMLE